MTREQLYVALFAKLQASAGYITASRRLQHWNDVAPEQQPALFLAMGHEEIGTTPGLNPVSKIVTHAYVYARTSGQDASPATIINPLIDAIQAVLTPEIATNKQTLGGLVQHCWIEGRIETDEGVLGDQGVAIIPIVMKVAQAFGGSP